MAYSRYRRKTRRSYRRPVRNVRKATRALNRKYRPVKRRAMPRMSKRSVLNVSSEKKRDKLLQYTNSTAAAQSGSTTYSIAPAIITGGTSDPALFIWCSTARDNTINSGGAKGTKFDQATRTSSTCYMVGLSEKLQIQCTDGLPWEWRRVCFTAKAGSSLGVLTPSAGFFTSVETSNGFVRLLNQIQIGDRTAFYSLFFQGAQNVDWTDPLMAKVDTERLTVKYDKTISISSGNQDGFIRKYSRYHPMNKNLVYNDDEVGGGVQASQFSVQAKAGMGDYWVVDFFRPRAGSTSSNQLALGVESTLYWHEK